MEKTGFFTRMNEVGEIALPEGLRPKNNELLEVFTNENGDIILRPRNGKE